MKQMEVFCVFFFSNSINRFKNHNMIKFLFTWCIRLGMCHNQLYILVAIGFELVVDNVSYEKQNKEQ